jgi:hypothetical protein
MTIVLEMLKQAMLSEFDIKMMFAVKLYEHKLPYCLNQYWMKEEESEK